MKAMLAANPDATVEVMINGTDKEPYQDSLKVGEIAANAPVIEGYEFVNS